MSKSIFSERQLVLRQLLRDARKKAGFQQIDLAERLGRSQSYVSNYERGEKTLDLIELMDVCAALGISVTKFTARFEKEIKKS